MHTMINIIARGHQYTFPLPFLLATLNMHVTTLVIVTPYGMCNANGSCNKIFLSACVIVMAGMGYKANNFCSLYKRLTCAHPHHSGRPVATSTKKNKTTETS